MRTESVELGYLAAPPQGAHPGIVMLHDVWGLSDHTRDLARRLAAERFTVLALDLYRREGALQIEDPGAWMRALSDPQVLSDVQAALRFLAARPETSGARIGVTGFCMGGMYALMAGCACEGVSAVVAFYGLLSHEHGILHDAQGLDPARKPRQPLDWASALRCPLLAFYGDRDEFVPLEDVRALEARLATSGQPAEIVVVPDAGHAFMNDTRPDAYRPELARLAWERSIAFFGAKLRG
ncbi:MAG: dienelactone hydrolase family protein [Myxococcales bacterium]|nr:dienelactone hydrolase family protein [Myxococcales bacterium]MDH5307214.1 dienelactone hydrolase family protein [Myxococcales bacterium]MDH5567369.1 dienelactone hydrolase family protein [Myxococcales bacterium]